MSAGGNIPPYRMPCSIAIETENITFINAFTHDVNAVIVDKFSNSTLVPAPISGPDVAPYERWTIDESGGESCESHNCDPTVAPCSEFTKPFPTNTFTAAGTEDLSVRHKRGWKAVQFRRFWQGSYGFNSHERSPFNDSWFTCSDTALANNCGALSQDCCSCDSGTAFGNNRLPGRCFENDAIGATGSTWAASDGSAPSCKTIIEYESYQPTPSQTKYLQMAIAFALSASVDTNSGTFSPSVTLDVTVAKDKNSGLETVSDLTLTQSGWDAGNEPWESLYGISAINSLSTAGVLTLPVVEAAVYALLNGISGYENVKDFGATISISETSISVTAYMDWHPYSGIISPATDHADLTLSIDLSVPNTAADIYTDGTQTLLAEFPLDDDALYPWRTDSRLAIAPLISRSENGNNTTLPGFLSQFIDDYNSPINDRLNRTPSDPDWTPTFNPTISGDPNSSSMIVAVSFAGAHAGDVIDTQVSGLANPSSYSITGGSLPGGVSMDSSGHITGTVSADGNYGVNVTITGTAEFTGDIVGTPLAAGYQNYFDFAFVDYVGCCYQPVDNPGFNFWDMYQLGWGMNAATYNSQTGAQLPLNCTQWTNNWQAQNKPPGAFIIFADGSSYYGPDCTSTDAPSMVADGGALWGCKYAEILDGWNSQNFARPAGDDKFSYDETQVVGVTSLSGSGTGATFTSTDYQGNPITIPEPDGVWGGPSVGGFYLISVSGSTVTLGTQLYNVPSNWQSASDDNAYCFGKLRFVTHPSLLGRIPVTSLGMVFTFQTAQPAFGMLTATGQEQVDVFDVNMTAIATNVTATRMDDSNFTLSASHPTAFYVMIHGAAKWYMNDAKPKGDYAILEFADDFRTNGEYGRLLGQVDCSSVQIPEPSQNRGYSFFSQTQMCLPFLPCNPKVVCISPNGEVFPNGYTTSAFFDEALVLDERYGTRKQIFVQATMTDILWQKPHQRFGIVGGDVSDFQWLMDDGSCLPNQPDATPPIYYYAHMPQVEARLSVPCNYGAAQNECGPDVPPLIQIGWLSPVLFTGDGVALPPAAVGPDGGGIPNAVDSAFALHQRLCNSGDCRFNYAVPGCSC